MAFGVEAWWAALSAVAVFNITAWLLSATALKHLQVSRLQLVLSGIYVFGCAFRSFLPVYDIPRICLVDSWASSVLVGRSIATLAEVAFAAQWAVLLREHKVSRAIVPLIVIAEVCSWYAVLTTANLGHVFENSLWGISAALIVASLLLIVPRCPANRRPVLAVWSIGGALYVAYIFLADVPMYWSRWIVDQANARDYLTIAQGVVDASRCKLVSFRWEDWRNEVTWMSLYFSVGVWVSISLIFVAMPFKRRSKGADGPP